MLAADGSVAATSGGCVLRRAPMIKNIVPIPNAEISSDILRPRLSTRKKTKMAVATTLTTPYIPEARRETDVPV